MIEIARDGEALRIEVRAVEPGFFFAVVGLFGRETLGLDRHRLVYVRGRGPFRRERALDTGSIADIRVTDRGIAIRDIDGVALEIRTNVGLELIADVLRDHLAYLGARPASHPFRETSTDEDFWAGELVPRSGAGR
jgi:hypothetical protein